MVEAPKVRPVAVVVVVAPAAGVSPKLKPVGAEVVLLATPPSVAPPAALVVVVAVTFVFIYFRARKSDVLPISCNCALFTSYIRIQGTYFSVLA